MAPPKGPDRPRSIRIPCDERTFKRAHELAGKVPLSVYLRDLIDREYLALKKAKGAKK